jgi:peptide/nickel transport system substrate-binding protein
MNQMPTQTTRRRLIQTAGGAAAGLALAPLGARVAHAAPRAQDDAKGGTVTYAYILKPVSLDATIWSGDSDNQVSRQIFDSLVYSPEAGKFEPWLASSWEMSSDGLVYTFKLRDDVTFHDGTPFNADAVKFTFDRMLDPASKSLQTGYLGPYDRTEAVDEYTVAIHLKEPFGPLLPNLSHVALAPISPTAAKQSGTDFAQQPVGTGPFKFEKWEGNDLHLVRNEDYNWPPASMDHTGPAYLESLIYKEVAEAATRMTVLQTGEANVTHYPVLEDVASLKDQGFQVFPINTPGFVYCFPLNVQYAPTDDLKVRQAIIQGVDRQTVVKLIAADLANVAYGPLTRPTLGYDPAVESYYPYDAEKAGALLDEAGWVAGPDGIRQKDGQPLKLEMIMFDSENNKAAAELVQAMLQKLGFDASLDVTAYDAFADHVSTGKFNTSEMNWTAIDPDLVVYDMFSSKQVDGEGQFNRSRYADPHMDDLIAQGQRTADVEERKRVYSEIQKIAMDQALILPLWDGSWITLAAPAVQSLRFDQIASPLFYNAWVQ